MCSKPVWTALQILGDCETVNEDNEKGRGDSWAWWRTSVSLTLGNLRQEDCYKFETSLSCIIK